MFNNIGTLILLLCFVVSVFGTATFRVGNQTLQYHTQDLFEVERQFNPNSTCEILPSVLNTAQSALDNVKSDNATSVIIAIDAIEANEYGCTTIAHTGVAVFELNQYLNDTSNFSIDTVLYIPDTTSGPGFGAYPDLPYTKYGFGFYEDVSPVNIALLAYDNYHVVVDASNNLDATVIVTVEEEPGPWNDVFLATGYRIFIYFILTVLVSITLYSLVILYRLIKTKKTITRHHVLIYVSALCAAIVCASGLALKLNGMAYKWIRVFQNFFISVGFYALLLLWYVI
ncbi:hypothetical protein BDF19DRAFT_432801 [Syncephalis fuscata]|nr:hypothetical protein BDF19DRAFT_432801 [Syncephalis fuscata]